jgi:hypothetical protein
LDQFAVATLLTKLLLALVFGVIAARSALRNVGVFGSPMQAEFTQRLAQFSAGEDAHS